MQTRERLWPLSPPQPLPCSHNGSLLAAMQAAHSPHCHMHSRLPTQHILPVAEIVGPDSGSVLS